MSFAIRNEREQHLGFLLTTGGPDTGDCIFRSLPNESDLLDTPESAELYRLQRKGEFMWERKDRVHRIVAADGVEVASIEGSVMTSNGFTYDIVELPARA